MRKGFGVGSITMVAGSLVRHRQHPGVAADGWLTTSPEAEGEQTSGLVDAVLGQFDVTYLQNLAYFS